MKLTGLSILGSSRAVASEKPNIPLNPATGSSLQPGYYSAAPAEVDEAAKLASGAFAEVSQWPGTRRQDFLNRIAELLQQNGDSIVDRAGLETALPKARLQGELARTCFQLRLCGEAAATGLFRAARIDHADPSRKPLPKPDLRSMMIPLGPVVVFSASNFPLAFSVAGGDTASAFAAGCPVIVKPHQGHPGTSEMVALLIQQAAQQCGAPEGVFSMLFGSGRDVGIALVKHPLIKAVGFTGSRSGGRALMDAAAGRPEPIPVYAEMGSINPVFVMAGALRERADELAAGLHASVTLGVGQFCTNPGLIFIEAGEEADQMLRRLSELMAGTPPGTMLTSGLCAAYHQGVEKFSLASEVECLARVLPEKGTGNALGGAALFVATAEAFLANRSLMDEVFGPSTLVIKCASREQMLNASRALEGQLTATVHATAEELQASSDLIQILSGRVGRLVFNGFPTGVEVAHAMTHGGPYPATSDGRSTSVGTRAIERFLRPICYQNFPDVCLPAELQEANPLDIRRLCDGKWS